MIFDSSFASVPNTSSSQTIELYPKSIPSFPNLYSTLAPRSSKDMLILWLLGWSSYCTISMIF